MLPRERLKRFLPAWLRAWLRPWPGLRAGRRVVSSPPGRRVLVLAPHPDDETFGCGGALALWRRAGAQVRVLFLTGGERAFRGAAREALVAQRRHEARAALTLLGVQEMRFLDLPDGGLEAVAGLSSLLAREVRSFRPETVLAPSPWEEHPDHRAAALALAGLGLPRVLFYEVWSPLPANLYLRLPEETLALKLEALSLYRSQHRVSDLVRGAEALARYRGAMGGNLAALSAAEAFFALEGRELGPFLRLLAS